MIKASKQLWCCIGAILGVCVSHGESVDGTIWLKSSPYSVWGNTYNWIGEVMAKDGGVATINDGGWVYSDQTDLRIGGLNFTTCETCGLMGNANHVTLTGDAFLDGRGWLSGNEWKVSSPEITVHLDGTGDNTITKKGAACYTLEHPIVSIGRLVLADGTMKMTKVKSGTFLSDATTVVRGGVAEWESSALAGEDATAALATGSDAKLIYGAGAGWIAVDKAAGASATLTLGPLEREAGGVLTLIPKSGIAELGTTERIKVTTAPAVVNGMVDATIVARDVNTESRPYHFLTYDPAAGFIPATYTEGLEGGATSIAHVTSDTVLDHDVTVLALVIDNRAKLQIASGVTLTVGDGVHPAGVIFNEQTGTASETFEGAGTLAFASSEAVIYHASPSSGRWLTLKTKIAGAANVVLQGGDGGNYSFIKANDGYCQWSGVTHVSGTRLYRETGAAFPNSSELWLHGTERLCGTQYDLSGSICNYTTPQTLHIAGVCPQKIDGKGLFYIPAGYSYEHEISGKVVCENDAMLYFADPSPSTTSAKLLFKKAIEGVGGLAVDGVRCQVTLGAVNTFGGAFRLLESPTVIVSQAGTLGRGPVELAGANASLLFKKTSGTVTNDMSGVGRVGLYAEKEMLNAGADKKTSRIKPTAVDLTGRTHAGALALHTAATVGIGPDVTVSRLDGATGETIVRGVTSDATLTLDDDGSDQALAVQMTDGTGRLSVVKKGSGKMTYCGPKVYTGKTTIDAGTLCLEPDVLKSPDVAYWLDATKESTIQKDGAGTVTSWASANGNGVSFAEATKTPSYVANAINGMAGIRFQTTDATSDYDYLAANADQQQRTVFIVTVTHHENGGSGNFPAIFGIAGGYDYGLRYDTANKKWRQAASSAYAFTTAADEVYVNGNRGDLPQFTKDVPYVLTIMHGNDDKNQTGATFIPSLGGYNTNGRYAGAYGEVIAFKRLLTTNECKMVENYLAKKWGVAAAGFHSDVETVPMLPAESSLEIHANGTLDLNGVNLTVSGLSGEGRIVNAGDPVTLTVRGVSDFKGVIDGNVTLRAEGLTESALTLNLKGSASLVLDGATTSLAAYTPKPPTSGLLYWLDASKGETVQTNENGVVLGWQSRTGNSLLTDGFSAVGEPTYVASATGFAGKPAVHFNASDSLVASASTDTRTLFLVCSPDGSQQSLMGVFGWYEKDIGFRYYDSSTQLAVGYSSSWSRIGDGLWVNGTRFTSLSSGLMTVPQLSPYLLVWRQETAHTGTSSRAGKNCINRYYTNATPPRGATQWVAEAIAYNRVLTNEEVASVQKYLMDKWVNNTTSVVPPENTSIVNGTGSLAVAGATTLTGDVDLGDSCLVVKVNTAGEVETVTVNGNLTLGAAATLVIDDYTQASKSIRRHRVVAVSGSVSGEFSGSNVAGGIWRLNRRGNTWLLSLQTGLAVVVK